MNRLLINMHSNILNINTYKLFWYVIDYALKRSNYGHV